jgi:hypothetical protein
VVWGTCGVWAPPLQQVGALTAQPGRGGPPAPPWRVLKPARPLGFQPSLPLPRPTFKPGETAAV